VRFDLVKQMGRLLTRVVALGAATLALAACLGGEDSARSNQSEPSNPAGPLIKPLEGWELAYASAPRPGGPTYLFVANADGTHERQIDRLRGEKHQPFWSPDGTRIAFRWLPISEDYTPLVVINADGSGVQNLTKVTGLRGWAPSWSPDGKRLVTAATPKAGNPNSLYTMNPDGSNLRRITKRGREAQYATWSPTSDVIAFTFVGDGGFDIFTIHSDGSDLKRLTHDGARVYNNWPMWSPDGKEIAWGRGEGIWIMNADGTNKRQVTTAGGVPGAWSPGPFITFQCNSDEGQPALCAVRKDGSGLTRLLDGKDGGFPGWRPHRP
jgi:TolB protein